MRDPGDARAYGPEAIPARKPQRMGGPYFPSRGQHRASHGSWRFKILNLANRLPYLASSPIDLRLSLSRWPPGGLRQKPHARTFLLTFL